MINRIEELYKRIVFMHLCSEDNSHPPYRPGLDQWSMYKSIWLRHWEDFKALYPRQLEGTCGRLGTEKAEEAHKLICCGLRFAQIATNGCSVTSLRC